MVFTAMRQAPGLQAVIEIEREGGRIEVLPLVPEAGNPARFMSAAAPQEPHEFTARLRLSSSKGEEVLPFGMVEPGGHH